jgi:hypothetical protein
MGTPRIDWLTVNGLPLSPRCSRSCFVVSHLCSCSFLVCLRVPQATSSNVRVAFEPSLILVSRSKLYCEGLTPRLNISESGSYDVGGTPAEWHCFRRARSRFKECGKRMWKFDNNNGFSWMSANGAVLFKGCAVWLQLAAQLDRCCKAF